ncbi:MAG: phage holin family protein, partial [Chloroflexi bacterium]|nr:phage holin family protein [Chloroflexota bacterium]
MLNALLWPMLSYLILLLAVLTLVVAALAPNGAIILLAAYLVEGFQGNGLWTAIGCRFWLIFGHHHRQHPSH